MEVIVCDAVSREPWGFASGSLGGEMAFKAPSLDGVTQSGGVDRAEEMLGEVRSQGGSV